MNIKMIGAKWIAWVVYDNRKAIGLSGLFSAVLYMFAEQKQENFSGTVEAVINSDVRAVMLQIVI